MVWTCTLHPVVRHREENPSTGSVHSELVFMLGGPRSSLRRLRLGTVSLRVHFSNMVEESLIFGQNGCILEITRNLVQNPDRTGFRLRQHSLREDGQGENVFLKSENL